MRVFFSSFHSLSLPIPPHPYLSQFILSYSVLSWDVNANGRLRHSPVFVVSNVLLVASPPALTLAQITQAASGDAFERLISKTIFWSYCVVTPPSTILFVVIGLILSKL